MLFSLSPCLRTVCSWMAQGPGSPAVCTSCHIAHTAHLLQIPALQRGPRSLQKILGICCHARHSALGLSQTPAPAEGRTEGQAGKGLGELGIFTGSGEGAFRVQGAGRAKVLPWGWKKQPAVQQLGCSPPLAAGRQQGTKTKLLTGSWSPKIP
jgi:hypothetical protein